MRHQRLKFRSELRVVPGLRTLNSYAPPAYDRRGEPLPRGRK
jgi:hypothetical protein